MQITGSQAVMYIIFEMIFCHVIADYNLQGWLAAAKQKEWWTRNCPGKLYRQDWSMALFMHAFSWTFLIMLPIAIHNSFCIGSTFILIFSVNVFLHATIDNMKANKLTINLIVDQILHLIQIIGTAILLVVLPR